MAVQKCCITANIEKRRRVVDFSEAHRVVWFVPGKKPAADRLDGGYFAGCVTKRTLRMKSLCYCGGKAVAFESGERGAKDGFGAAQFPEELAGHAGAEARSERKRHPSQVVGGVH